MVLLFEVPDLQRDEVNPTVDTAASVPVLITNSLRVNICIVFGHQNLKPILIPSDYFSKRPYPAAYA
jgi:hypothetical protein